MTANLPTSLATIGGDDLAVDQPIDQEADGGQVLIDRRLCGRNCRIAPRIMRCRPKLSIVCSEN